MSAHPEARVRDVAADLLATMSVMPYGALEEVRSKADAFRVVIHGSRSGHAPGHQIDPLAMAEAVAKYMDALRHVLESHASRHQDVEDELSQLRRDVSGMRRLLGIGGGP